MGHRSPFPWLLVLRGTVLANLSLGRDKGFIKSAKNPIPDPQHLLKIKSDSDRTNLNNRIRIWSGHNGFRSATFSPWKSLSFKALQRKWTPMNSTHIVWVSFFYCTLYFYSIFPHFEVFTAENEKGQRPRFLSRKRNFLYTEYNLGLWGPLSCIAVLHATPKAGQSAQFF